MSSLVIPEQGQRLVWKEEMPREDLSLLCLGAPGPHPDIRREGELWRTGCGTLDGEQAESPSKLP